MSSLSMGSVKLLLRRDTESNWEAADPVLLAGELGYDQTTSRLKIGDGVTAWTALPFFSKHVRPYIFGVYGTATTGDKPPKTRVDRACEAYQLDATLGEVGTLTAQIEYSTNGTVWSTLDSIAISSAESGTKNISPRVPLAVGNFLRVNYTVATGAKNPNVRLYCELL